MNVDDLDPENRPLKPGDHGSSGEPSPIPPQLQNWRVVEVAGEVLSAEDSAESSSDHAAKSDDSSGALSDVYDDLVVLTLSQREFFAAPGDEVSVLGSVLNNCDETTDIEIACRGQVNRQWMPDLPLRIQLQPGERYEVALRLSLPQGPSAESGELAFAIGAAQANQPLRRSQAVCTLHVERCTRFRLGIVQPAQLRTIWWSPSGAVVLPVSNLSNHATKFRVVGVDSERECLFEFDAPGKMYPVAGEATFTLAAGERAEIGVSILSRRQHLVRLASHERPYRIAVQLVGDATDVAETEAAVDASSMQMVEGRITFTPLLGPWQVALLAGLVGLVMLVMVATSAGMLFALRPTSTQVAALPTIAPTPQAPPFALVLSMDEPVPTRAATPVVAAESMTTSPPAPTAIVVAAPESNGLPIVQADQVSAPGETVTIVTQAPPTAIAVAPVASDRMTYAEMFQEIANRYDLNWRLLASIGYVESGFDSTAVGLKGSLGLMQIHPVTWDEWAPRADVRDPFETYSNVLVAAIYLDYLRATLGQKGFPQTEWMLAAYNWGPDKVLDLLARGGEWTDLPVEVQRYTEDVLRITQSIPN